MKKSSIAGIPYGITRAWVSIAAIPPDTGTLLRLDDLCVNNGVLYAIGITGTTITGRFRVFSYDPVGNSWTDCGSPTGATTSLTAWKTCRLVSKSNVLYALAGYTVLGTTGWVYSFNSGTSWTSCGQFYTAGCTKQDSLVTDGTALYVCRSGSGVQAVGRWTSGTTWTSIGTGGGVSEATAGLKLFVHSTTVMCFTQGTIRANDRIAKWVGGTSWTDIGIPTYSNSGYTNGMASDGSQLYVGHVPDSANLPEIFAYTAPSTWDAKGTLNNTGATSLKSMLFNASDIYAGSTSEYVEKLTPPSVIWTEQPKPFSGSSVTAGVSFGGVVYYIAGTKIYYRSSYT